MLSFKSFSLTDYIALSKMAHRSRNWLTILYDMFSIRRNWKLTRLKSMPTLHDKKKNSNLNGRAEGIVKCY